MAQSSPSKRSFVFGINDGFITPIESVFQTPTNVLPPPPRRLDRSSRPPPLSTVVLTDNLSSCWFDETPTQSMFSIETSEESLEDLQEWLDDSESPICDVFSQRDSDRRSTFTFGRDGAISPSQSSESHGSSTMVSADFDGDGIKSKISDPFPFDILDEELLTSPMDSFAALCWESAVSDPGTRLNASVPELRISRLYDNDALEYEDQHQRDSFEDAVSVLPRMQFSTDFTPGFVPREVAPWLYLPKKAISLLDLPNGVSETEEQFSIISLKEHHNGQKSWKVIAAKCRRALGCVSRT